MTAILIALAALAQTASAPDLDALLTDIGTKARASFDAFYEAQNHWDIMVGVKPTATEIQATTLTGSRLRTTYLLHKDMRNATVRLLALTDTLTENVQLDRERVEAETVASCPEIDLESIADMEAQIAALDATVLDAVEINIGLTARVAELETQKSIDAQIAVGLRIQASDALTLLEAQQVLTADLRTELIPLRKLQRALLNFQTAGEEVMKLIDRGRVMQ